MIFKAVLDPAVTVLLPVDTKLAPTLNAVEEVIVKSWPIKVVVEVFSGETVHAGVAENIPGAMVIAHIPDIPTPTFPIDEIHDPD